MKRRVLVSGVASVWIRKPLAYAREGVGIGSVRMREKDCSERKQCSRRERRHVRV